MRVALIALAAWAEVLNGLHASFTDFLEDTVDGKDADGSDLSNFLVPYRPLDGRRNDASDGTCSRRSADHASSPPC